MTATKTLAPFEAKAVDFKERTFEGYSSTWDMDLVGDVIRPGAYSRTLREWKAAGDRRVIPLIDQHDYSSIRNVLGKMVDARENDRGLWSRFRVVEGEDGDGLLYRVRMGALNSLSIGYRVVPGRTESGTLDGKTVRYIKDLDLLEVSAVIYPANPEALIASDSVKQRALGPGSAFRITMEDQLRRMEGREAAKRQRIALESQHRDLQFRAAFGAV